MVGSSLFACLPYGHKYCTLHRFFYLQSMAGIAIDEEVTSLFNDIKTGQTHKWATFKIGGNKTVEVDERGDPCATEHSAEDKAQFDELKSVLTLEEPRYCLYDFGFTNKEGKKINKLALIRILVSLAKGMSVYSPRLCMFN